MSAEPVYDCTVAEYLARRLQQLGITHVFGVPGNHLAPFLTTMQARTDVRWVGTPTEGGAGQAADAYARLHGVGAAAVTYSVGSFNLLNAVGGAYAEYVPLIAINACPTHEQWLNFRAVGLLTSHMSERRESNLDVYRQVTVDAQVISNPALAPLQIDGALTACVSEHRPVYLEVMEDIFDAPCEAPKGELKAHRRPVTQRNTALVEAAVKATLELIRSHERRPILWAGEEIDRFDLAEEFTELVKATGIPFCTTVGAKSVVSEDTSHFHGVYNGLASDPAVREMFKHTAKCRIGLGSWSTSKNLGGEQSIGTDWAVAAREGVSVGTQYFPDVQLDRFIPALRTALVGEFGPEAFAADYYAEGHAAGLPIPETLAAYHRSLSSDGLPVVLSYDGLFQQINDFLREQALRFGGDTFGVVSDAGFALLGSMNLHMSRQSSYLAQNSWLSIGYSLGAATGVGFAAPPVRPLVFIGDGAFQETCQELSTHTRHGLRSVVFVLDNEAFYGIEQMLVDPAYFREPQPSDGAEFYNLLHPWNYEKLAQVFETEKTAVTGLAIGTPTELDELLGRLADPTDPVNAGPIVVHVRLSRHDYPQAFRYKVYG